MTTKYPLQIDGPSELTVAVDKITPVDHNLTNAQRGAIIAVESTLGVKPAGVYGTVRNRLDTLETIYTSGSITFSSLTVNFIQPLVGSNVLISVNSNLWMNVDQIIHIATGGYYKVISKISVFTVNVQNVGYAGNALPTTVINTGSNISPGGVEGVNAYSLVTSAYMQPTVSGSVLVTVDTNEWISVGQNIFIETGGYYTVLSLTGTNQLTIENIGDPVNAVPLTLVPMSSKLSPAGTGASVVFAGDLSGTLVSQTVVALQNTPVNIVPPTNNQALIFNGVDWIPNLIVNANVDAAANIDGSKINPNFGSQTLTAGASNLSGTITLTSLSHLGPNAIVFSDTSGALSQQKITVLKDTYLNLSNSIVSENNGVWTRIGAIYWEPSNVIVPTVLVVDFEVLLESSSVTTNAEVRLYNTTLGAVISGSTLSTTSTSITLLLASGLTLPGTNSIIEVHIRSAVPSSSITCSMARLVLKPE